MESLGIQFSYLRLSCSGDGGGCGGNGGGDDDDVTGAEADISTQMTQMVRCQGAQIENCRIEIRHH